MISLLAIGYGSPLHRDDAAGRHVVQRVAAWEQPDVRAVCVRQLTPELSVSISQALRVVLVDA
jgi:Ni,Fe-hydrogenase maturation factor